MFAYLMISAGQKLCVPEKILVLVDELLDLLDGLTFARPRIFGKQEAYRPWIHVVHVLQDGPE